MINLSSEIQVFTTQTKHHEMITEKYALGFTFVIFLDDDIRRTVKFTCDTGWSSVQERMNKAEGGNLNIDKIDVLVAHIGSLKESELRYDPAKSLEDNENEENILYKHHLGLVGCAASIYFWKPEVSLLSEFGEELDALRKPLSEDLKRILKAKVLPTDLNFRIDIDTLNVMCFKSRKFLPFDDIKIEHYNGQLYPYCENELTAIEKEELSSHLGKTIKVF